MKKLLLIMLLFTGLLQAQIVNIPDPVFKAALVSADATTMQIAKNTAGQYVVIDTNGDGEIQESEAALISTLNLLAVNSAGVTSVEGIKSFVNLNNLSCSGNSITTIDVSGMLNLNNLYVSVNPVVTIDTSDCDNLWSIHLNQNPLLTTIITSENPFLHDIYAENNSSLLNLDLSGFPVLHYVQVKNNAILQTLDISDTFGLSDITVENNPQLSTLTILNSHINTIYASHNNLSVLNIGNCASLDAMDIRYNALTTLDLPPLPVFHNLNADHNQITYFSSANCPLLNDGDLTINPLEIAVLKNGAAQQTFYCDFAGLHYICVDEQDKPYFNSFMVPLYPNVIFNSYCSFTPGGDYNNITGNITYDINNNGCDNTDPALPYVGISMNGNTTFYADFSSLAGNYNFFPLAGTFSIQPFFENPDYFTITSSGGNVVFTNTNENSEIRNFCVAANGIHNDLEIVIAPITPARPGFDAVYKITYKNKGNQVMAQDYGVSFFYDQNLMAFVNADVTPSTTGSGGLTWNYANLSPFESRSFYVTFHINAPTDANPVNNGDLLLFTANISLTGTDETPIDNIFQLHQTVVGSFDPNDIICLEGETVDASEIGKYLHYVINFENTGTDAAQNIVVRNEIDPAKFDISSIQILSASHAVDARLTGNILELIFHNINLDTGGHGNVLLKIKSDEGLVTGNSVAVKGDIFFDYNFPVATNIATTIFQDLGIDENPLDASIAVYPNPAVEKITIEATNAILSTQLFDGQGRLLQTHFSNENETLMDISKHSGGIYFLKIITGKGIKIEKIVKK